MTDMIIGNHTFIPVSLYDWNGDDLQITPTGLAVLCDMSVHNAYRVFAEVEEGDNLPDLVLKAKHRRVKEYQALTSEADKVIPLDDYALVADAIDYYADQKQVMWL